MDVKGIAETMLYSLDHVVMLQEVSLLKSHIPSNELVRRDKHLYGIRFLVLKHKRVELIIGIGQLDILRERKVKCGNPNTL